MRSDSKKTLFGAGAGCGFCGCFGCFDFFGAFVLPFDIELGALMIELSRKPVVDVIGRELEVVETVVTAGG